MARNDQFAKDPKLPQPQSEPITWLDQLNLRLQQFLLSLISSINLLIQGYQYTTTTLVGSTFAPTAITRGRVVIVNGAGATPDKLYYCQWDGAAYSWKQIDAPVATTSIVVWQKIATHDTVGAAEASFDFTGLNGDADVEYKIFARIIAGGAEDSLALRFNGDAGANYNYRYFLSVGTATVAGANVLFCGQWGSVGSSDTELLIHAKSGFRRSVLSVTGRTSSTTPDVGTLAGDWTNTAANITSITVMSFGLNSNIGVGSHFELWAPRTVKVVT